ncbi:hypothetical protein [Lysobacter tyrosinilyticus]
MALLAASVTNSLADFVAFSALAFVIAVPVSLTSMLVVGLPYILWLRSRGHFTWLAICAGAAAIGAVAFACFAFLNGSFDSGVFGLGAAFGCASGAGFCVGAGPNNSFKPKPLRGSA